MHSSSFSSRGQRLKFGNGGTPPSFLRRRRCDLVSTKQRNKSKSGNISVPIASSTNENSKNSSSFSERRKNLNTNALANDAPTVEDVTSNLNAADLDKEGRTPKKTNNNNNKEKSDELERRRKQKLLQRYSSNYDATTTTNNASSSENPTTSRRVVTLLDGNARLRVCSDGRVSLFYAHFEDEEETKWELTSRSLVTVPPGAESVGRIVSDETTMKVEFLERSKSDGFESNVDSSTKKKVLSTLTIKPLSAKGSLTKDEREWTDNLTSGFILDYVVQTSEENEYSVEMAEIVTDVESSGKWFGGGHFVRQEWPLNGACQEVGPHYPFDFGPHGINTLVSNHWVTSTGFAIVADPETSFFHVGLNAPKENTFFEALTPNGSRRKFHTGVANILRPTALPLTSQSRQGDGKLRLQSRSGYCDSKYGAFSQEHPLVGWKSEKTHVQLPENIDPMGNLSLPTEEKETPAAAKTKNNNNRKNVKTRTCSMRVAMLAKRNVREATENVLESMPKPTQAVDTALVRGPKWSTWSRYKTAVDQEKVLKFASEILELKYERSIMEIDDRWSSAYGELEFDSVKFPDVKAMVDDLHLKGFKVTLWVTPFVTEGTRAYKEGVKNGYFVKSKVLTPGHSKAGFFSWWQPTPVVAIDLTNKDAREWFLNGLKSLQTRYGIDGFKFDAGEPCFLPKEFETKVPMKHPSEYTKLWSTEIAKTFELCEVRSGHHSTNSGVWTRIGDTFSSWTTSNGLRSLIPHLLTSSIVGYPLCLPDMIGGNAYAGGPSKELFVRWAQANCFMPAMQFSIPPWEFGKDVSEATNKILKTRLKLIDLIEDLSIKSSKTLQPICKPLWWLAPEDSNTFDINDQFCLGDDIVVAPVVYDKQRRREVYLPKGEWKEFDGEKIFSGGQWIKGGYEAGIYDIPAFVRVI